MTHDEIEAAHIARIKELCKSPELDAVWDTEYEPNYWRPLIGAKWEIDERIFSKPATPYLRAAMTAPSSTMARTSPST